MGHERSLPRPPLCHQLEYTIHRPELRSVVSTAAAEDNFFLQAVDATAASLSEGELTAVGTPLSLALVQFLGVGDLTAART